jgi:hypothetical protein
MKPARQNHLSDLIHSLSTNEKRYFKLFTGSSSGDKNYQKLFHAIEHEGIADKKELKKRLSHTTMNVSYEKAYLQKILMRSLRNFHEDSSPEISLHQTLIDIEILFNKQHYDICSALIKSALVLAEENEHFTMQLQLQKWYRRIMIRKGQYLELARQNKQLIAEERECVKKLENLLDFKDLQAQFLALLGQKGNARQNEEMDGFNELVKSPLLKDEKRALSHNALLLFFECWNWYYQHTLQFDKAYETCKSQVAYLEANPAKIILHPQAYMASLASLANRCSNINYWDEAIQVIEKMERMGEIKGIKLTRSLQTEILTFSVERRLMIYGFSRQFEKAIAWYEKTKTEIDKNIKALRPTSHSMYHQLVALCFVHTKRYEEALRHLRVVLDETNDSQRTDTFLYAHMLHVITHFELKNYQLLPYLIKALQRFAKSRNFTQESVQAFIKLFTELARHNDPKEVKQIVKKYLPVVKKLNREDADGVIIGTIDLRYWMEAKLK